MPDKNFRQQQAWQNAESTQRNISALGGLLLCCSHRGDGTVLIKNFIFLKGTLQRSDDSFGPLAEL
jgi:hypothetical protein